MGLFVDTDEWLRGTAGTKPGVEFSLLTAAIKSANEFEDQFINSDGANPGPVNQRWFDSQRRTHVRQVAAAFEKWMVHQGGKRWRGDSSWQASKKNKYGTYKHTIEKGLVRKRTGRIIDLLFEDLNNYAKGFRIDAAAASRGAVRGSW